MPPITVRRIAASDAAAYREAVLRSQARIAEWNPVDPDGFDNLLTANEAGALVTYLVIDEVSGGIAARVNVSNIAHGRFQNATLGYDGYDPYVGSGRTTAGLRMVVDECFRAQAHGGLGLHRLEINVQPANERSMALARRLGFRHEGRTPRMLFLDGEWRDHERFAITAEEWPVRSPA